MTISLHGRIAAGRVALIDDEDCDLVAKFRWHAAERGRGFHLRVTYAVARPAGDLRTLIYMHRLLTGYSRVDHIDHDGLNNQRSNLRKTTQTLNLANARRRSDNLSGFKGVCWSSQKCRWRAYVVVAGRQRHLGYFDDAEVAAHTYDSAATAAYGDFAFVNFPVTAIGSR